jgi:hypothetical protein
MSAALTIPPVTTGGEVPDALKVRIAALYVDVVALNEAMFIASRSYESLERAMELLGDGVDDRAADLGEETGLDLVRKLLLDAAEWACRATGCAPQKVDRLPSDLDWPSTAWPLS